LDIDTLTSRIPMRLQYRADRKLIMTPEGLAPDILEAILDGRQPEELLSIAENIDCEPIATGHSGIQTSF
jgi:hypothetical protein